jgi:hypothetical protein
MKNICLTESQYQELLNICKENRNEVSGTISVKTNPYEIIVTGVELDKEDLILNSSNKGIDYDSEKYINNVVRGIYYSTENVYVRFHTHPRRLASCDLSLADYRALKENQELAQKISDLKGKGPILVSECIVTNDQVGFYYYDTNKKLLEKFPLYVDGKRRKEDMTFLQLIKENIEERRKRK